MRRWKIGQGRRERRSTSESAAFFAKKTKTESFLSQGVSELTLPNLLTLQPLSWHACMSARGRSNWLRSERERVKFFVCCCCNAKKLASKECEKKKRGRLAVFFIFPRRPLGPFRAGKLFSLSSSSTKPTRKERQQPRVTKGTREQQ